MSDLTNLPVKRASVTVDSAGMPSVTPDPVVVTTNNALVVFSLDTPGYNFPETGAIVVILPNDQFPYSSWTIKPTCAAIYDKNSDAHNYKYNVTVVNTATGVATTLDPTIKNGNIGA